MNLASVHRLLGRSRYMARFARNVRNQANAVVNAYCSEVTGPDYWHNEFAVIDLVAPTAVNFIDVGANKGRWADRFVSRMRTQPIGVLFEPILPLFQALQQNFSAFPGVQIVNSALSDYSGEASFYENITDSELSSLLQSDAHTYAAHQVESRRVSITTLDREVEALGWQKCSFVKIDAEGEDFYCLRGARKLLAERRIDFVQFEGMGWHGVTMQAAVEYLQDRGYETYQLHPEGLRAIDFAYFGDSGSANWLAFHAGSPDVGFRIIR